MARKPRGNSKRAPLTDAERHTRFVEMAREVEAEESTEAFDAPFKRVVPSPLPKQESVRGHSSE